MGTYDPKKVTLSLGGIFISGFGDDEIEVAHNEEDAIIEHVGIRGEYSTTEQSNDSGFIKFTVKPSSLESMRVLEAFLIAKVEFPVLFKDTSTGTPLTVVSNVGRVKMRPSYTRGNEETPVEWTIAIPHLIKATI